MRQLTRQETILALLKSYRDVVEPLQRNAGAGDPNKGSRDMFMPAHYCEGSYKELERALARLRLLHRPEWWAVNERFLRSIKVRRGIPRGWTIDVNGEKRQILEYQMVETWDRRVDPLNVERGLMLLDGLWPPLPARQPQLPLDILEVEAA